jgi:hypothetical protein
MIIYGGISLIILLFLIGPIRARTLRRLDRVAPGSVAFTISNRRQFTDPLSLAGVGTELGLHATSLTSEPCVTADGFGISFWDNTPPIYVGTLDWDRISCIAVCNLQTPLRRWTASAIVLDVAVEGAVIPLPLLSPNGSNRMFASRRESELLAGRLESLRAAA